MLKDKLFELVLSGETLKRTEWVIKAFSLFREQTDKWKEDPYPYRIVMQPDGWYFVNPESNQLEIIEDAPLGQPIYKALDHFTLKAGVIENASKDYDTTYGNAFVNKQCLAMWFGNAIEFMPGKISPGRLSDAVLGKLEDDPEDDSPRVQGKVYVSDYLNYCNSVFNLVAYTQVFTPASTEKSMQQAPGIKELRQMLIEENKDRLHDPAVVASISKQLQEYDLEYLRGDKSMGFLLKDKSLKIVRTKLFSIFGADPGLVQTVDVNLIEKPLVEGWDLTHFPDLNNSQRAGSYNRGKETENGGAKVKEIYRATGNLKITIDDCGSKLGTPYDAKPGTEKQIIGFTVLDENDRSKQTKITKENVSQYIGKVIRLRSPQYCKAEETDYCKICCGDRLAAHPNAIAMEFTAYGSKFMDMYMQAAHAKELTVREIDYNRLLV